MARLIDADAFYNKLNDLSKEHQGVYNGAINDCMNLLDNQPIAYDVSKVVAELEENAQKMSESKGNPWDSSDHKYYKAISVKKATAIVKAGGVE